MKDTMKTEQAAKAAPVPDAPAFPVGTMEYFEAEAANVNGRDPRHAPPWITENSVLLKELADNSTPQPKAATASSLDAIVNIQHLEQLEDAITSASSKERLVVVKFYAPWCRTCFQVSTRIDMRSSTSTALELPPVHRQVLDRFASPLLPACFQVKSLTKLARGMSDAPVILEVDAGASRPLRSGEHREAARRARVQGRRARRSDANP